MSKPKSCSVQGCWEPRSQYSTRNMCEKHDIEADIEEQAEYEASPKYAALKALEEASTLEEVKDVIQLHLIEALL